MRLLELWTGKLAAIVYAIMGVNALGAIAFQLTHWEYFSNWLSLEGERYEGAILLALGYVLVFRFMKILGTAPVDEKGLGNIKS